MTHWPVKGQSVVRYCVLDFAEFLKCYFWLAMASARAMSESTMLL